MNYHPLTREALAERLAARLGAMPGTIRVAVDGPPCADPSRLADSLDEPLRVLSRPVVHVRAESFWRDASLRLEYGKQDVESYLTWLDADALRREVLDPIIATRTYLPSLRDPRTNRATREASRPIDDGTVLVVDGGLLLGLGLPFELAVHLAMSPAARVRHTAEDDAWTLAAFDRYDAEVQPRDVADVVVKLDDPRHPAVLGL